MIPPLSVRLLHRFPEKRTTAAGAGARCSPSLVFVLPVTEVGGLPGPRRLGGIVDSTCWLFRNASAPMSIRLSKKLKVAGFQYNAPTASSGAAIAVPPK